MTEKKRIIRFIFAKIKPAYHKLSDKEQQEFMLRDREKCEELGYKLRFMIDISGSNKEWQFAGVEEWPSMKAIQKIEEFYEDELERNKYVETKTYWGTPEFDEYTQSGITNR
jgi:hypothetical protein